MSKRTSLPFFLVAAAGVALILAACGDDKKSTPPEAGDFSFSTASPNQYVRIDRMGMPGVATALIQPGNRGFYNEGSPQQDATDPWTTDMTERVTLFHTQLDDDLTALTEPLTPGTTERSLAQAHPFIVPDVLTLDLTTPAEFPNGRQLQDPVMDITLAVLLLDLSVTGQTKETFAAIPLNPPVNHESFSTVFPFLASKH